MAVQAWEDKAVGTNQPPVREGGVQSRRWAGSAAGSGSTVLLYLLFQ